ncbi:Mechanosensory_abnormality MEC-17-like protein [Hexamita inflata]|uniref:Mechanosensory abnormality MEC-17-like protein n=1 Tax=Hexamita inflata TaxID=28002 RepID=A0AA86PQN9_9EUKA|nr:Mechanosensory abnormality MEC-17-like protein [Hexamita inflata]
MQFDFSISQLFKVKSSAIIILSPQSIKLYSPQEQQKIAKILLQMGLASQKAQGLPLPITSLEYIVKHNHTVILLVDNDKAVGIHKIGLKHLFQYDNSGKAHELTAFCCLDFYVHESCQRNGLGTLLFKVAECIFGVKADFWAFDKPSPKLFAFLKKNYHIDVRIDYELQVSKYAMSTKAVNIVGSSCAQILKDQKLGRVKFDAVGNFEESQVYTNQLNLLRQYLPNEVKCQSDAFTVQEMKEMSLNAYLQQDSTAQQKVTKRAEQVEEEIQVKKPVSQHQQLPTAGKSRDFQTRGNSCGGGQSNGFW